MAAQASAPPEKPAPLRKLISLLSRLFFPRHHLSTPVQVVARDTFPGFTESISLSGVRVHLHRDLGPLSSDLRNLDLVFPEMHSMRITAEVVEYEDQTLDLRFKDLSTRDRGTLTNWIEAQVRSEF